MSENENIKEIAKNKKARFNYEILETFEAGVVLRGTEVKSLRQGKANLTDAYADIKNGEAWIRQLHISLYDRGNIHNHEPDAIRKLLLHKREIKRLTGKLNEKGYTLVPLKMYLKNGRVKVLLGLGRGKAQYDKRESLKRKDAQRELQRAMKNYGR